MNEEHRHRCQDVAVDSNELKRTEAKGRKKRWEEDAPRGFIGGDDVFCIYNVLKGERGSLMGCDGIRPKPGD